MTSPHAARVRLARVARSRPSMRVGPSLSRWLSVCVCGVGLALAGCRPGAPAAPPSIELTRVPEATTGGPEKLGPIAGRVTGARPGERIVLFAKSGVWWVQPFADHPFTEIAADGTWKSTIHLGTEYAALLVGPGYRPVETLEQLPAVGERSPRLKPPSPGAGAGAGVGAGAGAGAGAADATPAGDAVLAVRVVKGTGDAAAAANRHLLTFSGYEWEVRDTPSDRGGVNTYDPANAWTDAEGALHLRLAQRDGRWTSAEVSLTRPLGYGTYLFVVRDTSRLDPTAAFTMLTWDAEAADQNHRELDIEISQWGVPASKNAQYVVQPYYVAANVIRFASPAGRVTHAWRWEPGRAAFRTMRGAATSGRGPIVAEHVFTSGVPTPGNETVRMNLYYFRHSPSPLQKEAEVVIEKFQYLP